MSSSLVITLKMNRAQGDLTRYKLDTSTPRTQCITLETLFKRLASGTETASFDVQTAAAAPVRATNTLTLTYAGISNNDTVVIAGTTLTCVTGTPSGFTQFKKQTDATVTATNLVAAVTGNTTLNKLMTAASVAGVVTLTLLTPGVVGNQVPLVGSAGIVVGAAAFANGAGGYETAVVNYSRGL
jgi:hypothetical protein